MRNILDYGAVGDGVTPATQAIQRAIDDGGAVYIPDGVFVTGTLHLKSNGGLVLSPGAVLRGSTDRNDYNADDYCAQNAVFRSEWVTGAHLISAVEQTNVFIEGHGTIDGSGDHWVNDSRLDDYWGDWFPDENRPGQMLFFCECENVRLDGVNIVNAPYWNVFLHGCRDATISSLNIKGARTRWTNDGIDIDCCRGVTVRDCLIDVGDDALTLRAHCDPLLHSDGACRDVTVTGCVLRSSRDNGVRVGVGNGRVTNCVLGDLIIEAPCAAGISIAGRWSDASKTACEIEDISFHGAMIRANRPVEILGGAGESPLPKASFVRGIAFSDCLLSVEPSHLPPDKGPACLIRGHRDSRVTDITFDRVTLRVPQDFLQPAIRIERADRVSFRGAQVSGGANAKDCCAVTLNGVPLSE